VDNDYNHLNLFNPTKYIEKMMDMNNMTPAATKLLSAGPQGWPITITLS
jgi:hypothetical protein